MRTKKILLIIISIILLFLGLCFYFVFNRSAYISQLLFSIIPSFSAEHSDGFIVNLLRDYGADLLWSTAFVLLIQAILYLKRKNIWYLMACSVLGILYELMQFVGIANGTGDIIDTFIYISGSAFGILIIMGGSFYEKG